MVVVGGGGGGGVSLNLISLISISLAVFACCGQLKNSALRLM